MKVGIIFECGPNGADLKVCKHLAKRLKPDIEIETFITAQNKPDMIQKCGKAAKVLLDTGCDRVIIIWDLYPPWRDKEPCRKEDKDNIRKSLAEAGVPTDAKVYLVCIEQELEAWLLADKDALAETLGWTHGRDRRKIKKYKFPERVENPKAELRKLFRAAGFPPPGYDDLKHAEQIIRRVRPERLTCCPSFVRFALKVADKEVW